VSTGLVAVIALVLASVFVVPLILRTDEGASVRWPSVPTLIGMMGTIVILGSLAWAIATDRFFAQWSGVFGPLTPGDRRSAQRQFAGKERVIERHIPVLRSIAHQERRTTQGIVPVYGGVMLIASSGLLGADDVLLVVSNSGVLVTGFALVAYVSVRYRQAGRFLDASKSP
jgi:hypothetical protein